MAKFWEFLTAVFGHWDTLMSGIFGLALVWAASWLYDKYYGPGTLPWYGYVFVALAFLFYACYRTWLEQGRDHEQKINSLKDTHQQTESALHQQLTELKAQLDHQVLHRTQRKALASFLIKGGQLRKSYLVPDELPDTAAKQWLEEVADYLRRTFDSSVVTRWASNEGILSRFVMDTSIHQHNRKICEYLSARLEKLEKLIDSLGN